MKNKNLVLAIVAALVVVIGAFIFLTREPTPEPPIANTEPERSETPAASLPAVAAAPSVTQTPIKVPVTQATIEPGVLAMVNGVQITEKDLGPGGGAQPPQSLAAQAMLDRAIDRELISQAADAKGVSLTAEQQKILADLPGGVVNSAAFDGGKAPEAEQRMQAQIDFQAREAIAQFLLSSLAQSPGQAAPESIPAQEQRQREYVGELRAAAKIEIAP